MEERGVGFDRRPVQRQFRRAFTRLSSRRFWNVNLPWVTSARAGSAAHNEARRGIRPAQWSRVTRKNGHGSLRFFLFFFFPFLLRGQISLGPRQFFHETLASWKCFESSAPLSRIWSISKRGYHDDRRRVSRVCTQWPWRWRDDYWREREREREQTEDSGEGKWILFFCEIIFQK